ncbi:MAG: cell division protein SepF [Clostridia bacterium]|nr:cell division protein SepF [Clostridia bacterium]
MASLWDRVLDALGFEAVAEEGEPDVVGRPEPVTRDGQSPPLRGSRRAGRGRLVSLPGGQAALPVSRVGVYKPKGLDDAQAIADELRARRPVVVNLQGLDHEVAQRILNFISGVLYALDGEALRVGAAVVLAVPGGVEVVGGGAEGLV